MKQRNVSILVLSRLQHASRGLHFSSQTPIARRQSFLNPIWVANASEFTNVKKIPQKGRN